MEHRWGKRIPVDMAVRIFARPSTIGAGRIQNLSMSGAWIGVHMDLPVLAHVMVVFESAPVGQRDKPSVGAYVTRTSEEGIGIEWYELDPLCLSELLHPRPFPRNDCEVRY